MRVSSAFIPDSRHRRLIRALVAADRDTDKIAMALGEIGNLWPDCCRRDQERDERMPSPHVSAANKTRQ